MVLDLGVRGESLSRRLNKHIPFVNIKMILILYKKKRVPDAFQPNHKIYILAIKEFMEIDHRFVHLEDLNSTLYSIKAQHPLVPYKPSKRRQREWTLMGEEISKMNKENVH